MKLLILLFVCTLCFGEEYGRRLPTDAPLKNAKEIELGGEHVIPVQSDNNDYYLIRMPSKNQPLHLFITPCNRPIHWQLRIPNDFALEPNTHPLSKHFNHVLHMRIPPLIEFTEDLRSREKLILLAGEENERRMEFYANSIEANYVVLNMSSNRQTNAKIFATTLRSQLDTFYPKLPKDRSLEFSINESKKNSGSFNLHLKWQIPDYLTGKELNKYRFCVLVSRNQPQYSICEESNEDLESMHCMASNISEMMMENFEQSERYYVSIFLHNILTGGSTAYTPIEFLTPSIPKPTPLTETLIPQQHTRLENLQQLNDASLMKHSVKAPVGSSNNYLYQLPRINGNAENVELVVHACNGYLRLSIYKNGELLRKTNDFIGLERFLISTKSGDQIRVQVTNDDKIPIHYWIWASHKHRESPFVDMPMDRSIKVIKRECNKAVLQFNRASNDENVRYCVHEKESRSDYFRDIINEPTEMCWASLPVGRQAVCFRSNESEPIENSQDQTLQRTFIGLKSSTTYRLDVSAQNDRKNAQPLPYRTLFIRTTDHC